MAIFNCYVSLPEGIYISHGPFQQMPGSSCRLSSQNTAGFLETSGAQDRGASGASKPGEIGRVMARNSSYKSAISPIFGMMTPFMTIYNW